MKITLGKLLDAIEKNGYQKLVGRFISRNLSNTNKVAACALGQAALNLHVEPNALMEGYRALLYDLRAKGMITNPSEEEDFWDEVWIPRLNDSTDMTVPEIAHKVRQWFVDRGISLDEPLLRFYGGGPVEFEKRTVGQLTRGL